MKKSTELFKFEGKQNVAATIRNVAKASETFDVSIVVVFASSIESVLALKEAVTNIQIIAVTFPSEYTALVEGIPDYVGIRNERDVRLLIENGVMIARGPLPFSVTDPSDSPYVRGHLHALGLFGGGLQLCIQAVLLACDIGNINEGERCIVMSADTALVARAGHSYRLGRSTSRFAIEHIICKPLYYQISRPATAADQLESETPAVVSPRARKALPHK